MAWLESHPSEGSLPAAANSVRSRPAPGTHHPAHRGRLHDLTVPVKGEVGDHEHPFAGDRDGVRVLDDDRAVEASEDLREDATATSVTGAGTSPPLWPAPRE